MTLNASETKEECCDGMTEGCAVLEWLALLTNSKIIVALTTD